MNQHAKITCTSRYVPENAVSNDRLATMMDTSDDWISSRTGIRSRNIVTNENTSDLCIKVAEKLLTKSGKNAEELDFILVATMTPDYGTPSVACLVQGSISANQAFAFDISAACSGFVYALSMGEKLIRTGKKLGMVIGGETLSKVLDWDDRSTAVLFGDGAAGVLLEASDEEHFLNEKLQADGQRATSLTSGYMENKSPFYSGTSESSSYLQMTGRDIYDFSLNDVTNNIREIVAEDVDYLLLHQANKRIIEKISKKLKVPRDKFLTNMEHNGNTSAASIPLLLDESVEKGVLELGSNQKIVLTGYGGGLTWGSILLTL
ncbi:3-oxoacyl-ACP synthase [Enterococcus plantarum]|uniref:Beta-ketoacyl-[acyl-carrier-protein] synthase III n=1 Tax=Enterococcus plantarum TaxID=1077675 RepID=A0A2W3Z4E8_9ENTE|nr:beta-ketoacyl-ACP synthase III [Enterococcus plantarum]MBO0424035.1 ketoacyl-ACP synthase III [Enterococcus plantarum]MBO0467405.1 ketoacyl-ACP synthase III [Enterococcus plantarum]OEG19769.1 3-oxoacyl-ACP synthase [Enterococcus plantarum]PZL74666.1 ketoacyl-ACP synthase III [Enterococcus plantarum]